jgi:hypothetical protein
MARNGGKFAPGMSGNPGGRPKVAGRVRAAAREHGKKAIERLAELMHDGDGRVAVMACNALLDRGFGKPMQAVRKTVMHVRKNPRDMSLAEIEARIERLKAGNGNGAHH